MKRNTALLLLLLLMPAVAWGAVTSFMSIENGASSTLDGGITDVAVTMAVQAGEGARFPSTYPFNIVLSNSEIVRCTNRSTDTLTITRAQEGTSGVAHGDTASVRQNVTALYLTEMQDAVNDLEDGTTVITGNVEYEDFDAQTILQATSDNTPVVLTVGEQTMVGRVTGGNIVALTPAQIRTLLATVPYLDNVKLLFGTTNQGSIKHDGTDFVFDSQEVGSGDYHFLGGDVAIGMVIPDQLLTISKSNAQVLVAIHGHVNAAGSGPGFFITKSRNTAVGSHTILQDGDTVGALGFGGSDGTAYRNIAQIKVEVDGVPGASDMPGRLIFSTTPDGSATLVEAVRINNAGFMGVGTDDPQQRLDVEGDANFAGGNIGSDAGPLVIENVLTVNSADSTTVAAGTLAVNGAALLSDDATFALLADPQTIDVGENAIGLMFNVLGAASSVAILEIGRGKSTRGTLVLHGDDGALDASITLGTGVTNDTDTNAYLISIDGGDFEIIASGGASGTQDVIRIDAATRLISLLSNVTILNDLIVTDGDITAGVAATKAGSLVLYANAATQGGAVEWFVDDNSDTDTDSWLAEVGASGDFNLQARGGAGGNQDVIRIDDTTRVITLNDDVSITNDLVVVDADVTIGNNGDVDATLTFDGDTSDAVFTHDEDNGTLDLNSAFSAGDGGTTNYVQFSTTGVMTLAGSARVTRDINIAVADLGFGATKPDDVVFGNYHGHSYDINDDSVLTTHLPHWADLTEDLVFHIIYYIDEAYATASGEVQWEVTWAATPRDNTEAIDAPTHTGTMDSGDINIPATAKRLNDVVLGTIPAASIVVDDYIGITLKRVALDAGTNPTADPVIIDVHFEAVMNKLGD